MTTPPQLAIIIEHHGRRSVLRLQGELDAANQDCLRRAICTVLDRQSPQILVLDLSELGFTDCAGLGAMVWAHKHLAEQGRELVLTGIQSLARRLLGLTGLDTLLHVSTPKTLDSPDKNPSRQHADTKETGPLRTQGRAAGGHSRTPKWSRSGNTWPGSLWTCSERTSLPSPGSATPAAAAAANEVSVLDHLRSGVQAGMVIPDAADTTLGSVRVMTE